MWQHPGRYCQRWSGVSPSNNFPRASFRVTLRGIYTLSQLRYVPSQRGGIEDVEYYRPGGLHPVSIGDTFANGRYKILHKLGSGDSSTVWLARNQEQASLSGTLMTLKILTAEASSKPKNEITQLIIPTRLDNIFRAAGTTADSQNIQVIEDHFTEEGPNGTHLCLVTQLAGPSVLSMLNCAGKLPWRRWLDGDTARKVAMQIATAVEAMHSAGFVHGDLTLSNILFRLSPSHQVSSWSDNKIYLTLGELETEDTRTIDNSPLGPGAPRELVSCIDNARVFHRYLLQENIIVTDFGQSFAINHPPIDHKPATGIHYMPPEARFESRFTTASDIWALACAIFEIRMGEALFEPMSGDTEVLKQIVGMLGKLPEPWWGAFKGRQLWFKESGEPKRKRVQMREGVSVPAIKSSISQSLRDVGGEEKEPLEYQWPTNKILEEKEVLLLDDLLGKMLKYRPEERITIQEVVQHPWFKYETAR